MLYHPDYITAREILLDAAAPVETERLDLTQSGGRILAQDLIAAENIPAFDRSPYDGYAFRAADTMTATREQPVMLRVLEEIPAGAVPTLPVTEGTASKILTGAPIPEGTDAVIKFEDTVFTADTVTLSSPAKSGQNIVRAGEDVRKGQLLARRGDIIDPGLAGTLASQGIAAPTVYRRPKVGILSTGSELVEASDPLGPGKIYNANRHTLETALNRMGYDCIYLGTAGDCVEDICALIRHGLAECDVIVSTGGVSVGNYDLTPVAMERSGITLLFRGVDMKPGMACAYGSCGGKLICALSGNPASALINFYAVALPALRKIAGYRDPVPQPIQVTLADRFGKKSPKLRFLRGTLVLRDGTVRMTLPADQGNVILSSTIGCNVMAIVPAGSGPVEAGTVLEGLLL
ncbi:MAG: molybdopterin molybdotransferase MoeA [Oscillibacter sp.]|nr:molybdopterin molybdotransferase MoeA [Oscillibacter sp.]